ncbi:vancomycin resistance histidine kinase VanS [Gorillibacterium timonense]|uniref:vancomycin resistance histidine kinase VanS n=1 Tax=Gorillibacterium timonense TaxID=1689269 RepID=UPI001651E488|nr:vancomycin resistance histidine kinase VanS [Gorillibacterium timonense]
MAIKSKDDFGKLKRKIFLRVVFIAIAALLIGILTQHFLIDGLFEPFFAESFIHLCQNLFHISYDESLNMYQQLFRNNKTLLMASGMFLLLLLVFYYALSQMTKYFNQVSTGMDQLVEVSDREITLSPEMGYMAAKLNKIKSMLEKRDRDAKEAEQRKNDLVVYLAHDIKTPLTSIIGYLSLLDEAPDMPQEQKAKYVGITLEKAYRLEQLIHEFFEITRFNLQTIVLNKEKIALSFMLQQMADEFYPILTLQHKRASVHVPDGIILYGDGDKLARVFNNILKNAIAYSYENSVIDIGARQQERTIGITFTNQGNPIPLEKLDTIFEKFYRLDSSRSSHTGGAGLGLAIAKEIVAAHGGTLTVESNQEHTVFTVILPMSNDEIRKP